MSDLLRFTPGPWTPQPPAAAATPAGTHSDPYAPLRSLVASDSSQTAQLLRRLHSAGRQPPAYAGRSFRAPPGIVQVTGLLLTIR